MNSTFADCFFDGRFGQFGAIRVEFTQSGHFRYLNLKIFAFFLSFEKRIRADGFGGAAPPPAAQQSVSREAGRAYTDVRICENTFTISNIEAGLGGRLAAPDTAASAAKPRVRVPDRRRKK